MKTFVDWLEYYNNLDVGPFLEALEKMRRFYSGLGVNILKTLCRFRVCHCSISCVECFSGFTPQSCMPRGRRCMRCSKGQAVVGGPSLVSLESMRQEKRG